MEKFYFILIALGAKICTAYSFKCSICASKRVGDSYSIDQWKKDQTEVYCPTNYTCSKMHDKMEDNNEVETRGCLQKMECDHMKNLSTNDDMKKIMKIKECAVACCVSDKDIPCNSGFAASGHSMMSVIMMMLVVLYGNLI